MKIVQASKAVDVGNIKLHCPLTQSVITAANHLPNTGEEAYFDGKILAKDTTRRRPLGSCWLQFEIIPTTCFSLVPSQSSDALHNPRVSGSYNDISLTQKLLG